MRVVVTGAGGFIGGALCRRLIALGGCSVDRPYSRLCLVDLRQSDLPTGPRVEHIEGSFTDHDVRTRALAGGVDLLFHVASLPGGGAEADYERGRAVNLEGTLALFDALASQPRAAGVAPARVVFSSSYAARGSAAEPTGSRPATSYGSHKAMAELMLMDLTRRGTLDGRALRLPGIVARPRARYAGFASAFISEIFHAVRAGEPFVSPVPLAATLPLQSVTRCVDNLLHAAELPSAQLPGWRVFALPTTDVQLEALADEIARQSGAREPDLRAPSAAAPGQAVGTRASELSEPCVASTRLGFRDDGSASELVQRALSELTSP